MVGRRFGAEEFAHSMGAGEVENRGEEFGGGDVAAAGGGDKNGVASEPGDGAFEQLGIRAKGAGFFGVAFGQAGWVENNETVFADGFVHEKFESVGLYGFVGSSDIVEGEISTGAFERVRADVEVGDGVRAAMRGVN